MSGYKSNLTAFFFSLIAFALGTIFPHSLQGGGDYGDITVTTLRVLEGGEEEEENPVMSHTIVVCIVLILILLIIVFEKLKDYLEDSCPREYKPVVESLFGELTVLGFVSIFAYVLAKMGWVEKLGASLFGAHHEEELIEVFEEVHFIIFFIMVFFVFQVLVLVKVSRETGHKWYRLEKQVRNPEVDWSERANSYQLASMHLTIKRWIYSYTSILPCCKNKPMEQERELLLYKALRDEFVLDRELDYPFAPSVERVPDDFNFGRYLGFCQASLLNKVVHVKISTWIVFALGMVVYYLFVLLVRCNEMVLAWSWVAMAWCLCFYNIRFEHHLFAEVLSAFASKGVFNTINHEDQSPLDSKSTGLLESGTADGDPSLPDWCRVDIERYIASRSYLKRCFAGGVPNRQESLYWMDKKGPSFYLFILQFDLLFVGIYAAIHFMQIGPFIYSEQPLWAFVLYVILATLPILNIAVNKKRLVAVLTVVCSLGYYRRPQVIASVIREEKVTQAVRAFIVVYKLRRFAMQAEPAKKQQGGAAAQVHYSAVFDQQEIAEVSRTFDRFDADGSGSITVDEFEALMSQLGAHLSQEQLHRMMDSLDTDQSGSVDKDEFIQWYADQSQEKGISYAALARSMFRMFDTSGSKELTIGAFKKTLDNVSNQFTVDEIAMLVNELDSDNSGTISEGEFEHLIQKYYPKELS